MNVERQQVYSLVDLLTPPNSRLSTACSQRSSIRFRAPSPMRQLMTNPRQNRSAKLSPKRTNG